jgi:hypothetical protein
MCFVWWLGNNDPIIDMHMDDLIVIGARTEDINNLKHEMTAHFRMSDQASSSTLRLRETGEWRHHVGAEGLCEKLVDSAAWQVASHATCHWRSS